MESELPPSIGPHEGRELELMLAGKKPLAMFNDDRPEHMVSPEIVFDTYVAKGLFVKDEIFVPSSANKDGRLRYYYYALPGEEWRIRRMIELHRGFFVNRVPTTRELETEIGLLLGYDEADIAVYIERFFAIKK